MGDPVSYLNVLWSLNCGYSPRLDKWIHTRYLCCRYSEPHLFLPLRHKDSACYKPSSWYLGYQGRTLQTKVGYITTQCSQPHHVSTLQGAATNINYSTYFQHATCWGRIVWKQINKNIFVKRKFLGRIHVF